MEQYKVNREKVASLIRIFNQHLVGPGDKPVNKTSAVQASGWAQCSSDDRQINRDVP